MAEGDDGQEKTNEPSAKRKQDAREEGRIVTSKEMFVFGSLAAGLLLFNLSQSSFPGLAARWTDYFVLQPGRDLDSLMTVRLQQAWWEMLFGGLVVAVPLLVIVLLLQFGMGGIGFSTKAMAFKPERINPMPGIARMVSAKALVELGKAVAKVVVLSAVSITVLRDQIGPLMGLTAAQPATMAIVLGDGLSRLVEALLLGLAVIGALDLFWQIHSLNKGLMMSHQELKQESKESNGSPEVKGRIRRMQIEASRRGFAQRAALDDVPQATAIIVNPSHFAVALRYVPGETSAPMILALGSDRMAQQIIERGRKAGIGVLEFPLLARALYFTGEIGKPIGDKLYGAVAAVLAHVYRLDRGENAPVPDIDIPSELRFNANGRPETGAGK